MYRTVVLAPQGKMIEKSESATDFSFVKTIPAYRKQEGSQSKTKQRKLRVAGYCRVSTNEQSQEGSVTAQETSLRKMITENPDWELAGIYKDTNRSGTSRHHRDSFNRMMQDAKAGNIDYIITKSISRFARNTIDALDCVQELRNLNPSVGVLFIKTNY